MPIHVVTGATVSKRLVKKYVDVIEGTDEKGRKVELRILDGETYVYLIDSRHIDSGTKLSEYGIVFNPKHYGIEGERDSDALCFECEPGAGGEAYRFIHSDVYKVLVVE